MLQMYKMFLSFAAFWMLLSFSACERGFQKTKSEVEYKIIKKGKGNPIKDGDFITVHLVRYMADTLVFDSHKTQPETIQYKKGLGDGQKYNIFEVVSLLSVGDSVALRVPLDSVLKDVPNKPSFYKKGSFAKIFLTVLDAKGEAEQVKENENKRNKMIGELVSKTENDKKTIQSYVADKKITGAFNPYNVFVSVLKEGTGSLVAKDSLVSLIYTGALLNGKVFDTNVERVKKDKNALLTLKAGIGQLIPGFDLSLVGQKRGSKVLFIIPSALAYGDAGAGDKIPASSILVFTIEIM